MLGEKGVAALLEQTLKQEKAADKKLTTIAESSVNRRAAKEWQEQTSAAAAATGMLRKGAEWIGSTVSGAVKSVLPSQAAHTPRKKSHGRSRTRAR